jgi:hypothetical protein
VADTLNDMSLAELTALKARVEATMEKKEKEQDDANWIEVKTPSMVGATKYRYHTHRKVLQCTDYNLEWSVSRLLPDIRSVADVLRTEPIHAYRDRIAEMALFFVRKGIDL